MSSDVASAVPVLARGRGSDFAELSRIIKEAGLLQRRPGYYAVKGALTLVALGAGWVFFIYLGDSWWQMLTAAFLAVVCTQLAFIGHDAGHRQIFRSHRANDAVGLLNGGLIGVSYGWWIGKHNRHHANPNHDGRDPDLTVPALTLTKEQGPAKRGILRWMAKYQAFLFFPLLLLEGLNLHWSSIREIWRDRVRWRRLEAALLAVHVVVYLVAVFVVLSPLTALVFIGVHQGLWGVYMGCSFAPNHKGMTVVDAGVKLDFLRKQVVTARNVRGRRWVGFVFGGLNYQIEHHLFPSMPQPNLRRARPIVRSFCVEHGIPYVECGLLRSYAQVLRHLHSVGAALRTGSG